MMTEPTPPHRRSPMEHERDASEPAPDLVNALEVAASSIIDAMIDEAIAKRPYNSNIAARAVVALVLRDVERVPPIDDLCEGWCETEAGMGRFDDCSACEIKRAIRALIPKGDA